MNLTNLSKAFLGQANFRIKQAEKLMYVDLIEDWSQASVFPLSLRNNLNESFPLDIRSEIFVSQDGKSAKAIIFLNDEFQIETALMVHGDGRNTACLSSQVGCPLACRFCSSGKSFKRNLSVDEILIQALYWSRYLNKKGIGRLSNIVFMGSGEPFLNYNNVFKAISYLNNPDYFNISSRRVSISTIGITEGIRKMSNEKNKVNLAVSLHFTDDKIRAKYMPGTKSYSLGKVFESVDYYIKKTNRKVMFEYMLLDSINDSKRDAEILAVLMKKPLYAVNLIKYNDTGSFRASSTKKMLVFRGVLRNRGVEVIERYRFNEDVSGACGQLTSKN